MKYYIKLLVISSLSLFLLSCTGLSRGKNRDRTKWRTIASTEERPARREITENSETQPEETSGSISPARRSGLEGVVNEEEGVSEKKSVSIFEPFDPEKETKKQEIEASVTGETPEKIRKELLGEEGAEEEYVTLNFEQAAVEEILNTVSETLGINLIMTPGVKGAITMQTSKPVPASELFQILQSVLEVNGLTLVKSGRYYKVVLGKDAKQYPIRVLSGKEGEDLPFEDSFITQIIPLDYIPVKDMINILQPFLSKSAPPMIQHEELNILIVNDLASNMKRLLRFVQELDKPLYQPKEKVFVYYVENGDAEKLANTLNTIYKGVDKSKYPFATPLREKPEQQATQPQPASAQTPQMIPSPFGPYFASEEVTGEVRITADKEINALIIVTSPRDYPAVLEIVKKLDVMPKQALIEVLLVDVTLSDRTEFGLGWFLRGQKQSFGSNVADVDLSFPAEKDLSDFATFLKGFPSDAYDSESELELLYQMFMGVSADVMQPSGVKDIFGYKMITDNKNFVTFLRMLNEMTTLNVISSPYIMALDNQKATIQITHDHPIPKFSQIGTTESYERTFEYKEVGLKLDVTPKINENNRVTLEIEQELSEVSEVTSEGAVVVNRRTAKTNVVVDDGKTIIIGGLIRNTENKSRGGIPFLSDIPVIGKLFSDNLSSINKTELLIFITPHVVVSQEDVSALTSEFENKVESLKELTEGFKQKSQKNRLEDE